MKAFQQEQAASRAAPAGANPMDTSGAGGGTIGTGQAPHLKNKDLVVMQDTGAPQQAQGAGQQPSPVV